MTHPMNDTELRELEARATKGPWKLAVTTIHGVTYGGVWIEPSDPDNLVQISGSGGARSFTNRIVDIQRHDDNDANAALIVAMRNNFVALLDRVQAAEARAASLEAEVEKARGERDEARADSEELCDTCNENLSLLLTERTRAETAETKLRTARGVIKFASDLCNAEMGSDRLSPEEHALGVVEAVGRAARAYLGGDNG